MKKTKFIFLSYDGMTEPLGQSQVINYLEGLKSSSNEIVIISAEKKHDYKLHAIQIEKRLEKANIQWKPVPYHKFPPVLSSIYDFYQIQKIAKKESCENENFIIHARNLMMACCATYVTSKNEKILFDTRGFWADERVDGGLWKNNTIYRFIYNYLKKNELQITKSCGYNIVLTNAAKDEIKTWFSSDESPPISVISTCADLVRFNLPENKSKNPFVFGYVGSIGTWYLFDETMAFFKELVKQEPEAKFLIINRHEHEFIRSLADKHGVDQTRIEIKAVEHSQMPKEIAKMHAAAALIKPCYSKIASAPTKLAEYLGCGVPCLGNVGVGDMEDILENRKTGIALRGFSQEELSNAAEEMIKLARKKGTAKHCREVALELFSLEGGVAEYRRIYEQLANGVDETRA